MTKEDFLGLEEPYNEKYLTVECPKITDDLLSKWEEIFNNVHQEPWAWEANEKSYTLYSGRSKFMHGYNILSVSNDAFDIKGKQVRDFIEMAHIAIPALIKEVRELEKYAKQTRELKEFVDNLDDSPMDVPDIW